MHVSRPRSHVEAEGTKFRPQGGEQAANSESTQANLFDLASRDRRRQTIANRLKSISCLPRTETNQRGNPNSTDAYMPGTEEGRSSPVSATGCWRDNPARPHGSTAKAAPVGFAPFFYTAQPTASAALWSPRPRHTKAKMAKIRPRPTRRLGALARKHDAIIAIICYMKILSGIDASLPAWL